MPEQDKNQDKYTFEDILKDALQHCFDMQKLGETKNAGLIAVNSAILLAVSKTPIDFTWWKYDKWIPLYYLCFVALLLITSICINLSAITAQLSHKVTTQQNKSSNNPLFFGSIANMVGEDQYLEILKSRYEITTPITEYNKDQAKQTIINAQIALRKFQRFNLAMECTIAAIGTPIAWVIYKYHGKNT